MTEEERGGLRKMRRKGLRKKEGEE